MTWLRALGEAAKERDIGLPPFTSFGMGVARTETMPNSRFVTLKRRLIPTSEATQDGMEWTLWRTENDLPVVEIAFRQPLQPEQEAVSYVLRILKGWLIDNWTVDETQCAVRARSETDVKRMTE
jgi:hypothetical protein